jgi:hypothetical protein
MKKHHFYIIYYIFFIIFLQPIEGKVNTNYKNSTQSISIKSVATQENTKEIRPFSKMFKKSKIYNKKLEINKQFFKCTKQFQKKFNMHTLNRPFTRHLRSRKIGIAPLHKSSKNYKI